MLDIGTSPFIYLFSKNDHKTSRLERIVDLPRSTTATSPS